ncbi:MAG: hypothetical protein NW207_09705 [Cytophagales bacterium]|nr:hypothetical protein [Cytophagales bacterium]
MSKGFVYVATGKKFVNEAVISAHFLKKHHPNTPIAIISDAQVHDDIFAKTILIDKPSYNLRDKTYLYLSPFEHTVFVDTDTYIAGDISELFVLLTHFDVAAHQLFEGHEYHMPHIPHAFPEFNTGVIAFVNNNNFAKFCDNWRNIFDKYLGAENWVNDQKSFREALYMSTLRHTVLPPEYNFRPLTTNFAIMPVKVFHGRNFGDMAFLEKRMNKIAVHRAYVPRFEVAVHDYMPLGDLYKLWAEATLQIIKEIFKYILPITLRNSLRNVSWIRKLFHKSRYQEWMQK